MIQDNIKPYQWKNACHLLIATKKITKFISIEHHKIAYASTCQNMANTYNLEIIFNKHFDLNNDENDFSDYKQERIMIQNEIKNKNKTVDFISSEDLKELYSFFIHFNKIEKYECIEYPLKEIKEQATALSCYYDLSVEQK